MNKLLHIWGSIVDQPFMKYIIYVESIHFIDCFQTNLAKPEKTTCNSK